MTTNEVLEGVFPPYEEGKWYNIAYGMYVKIIYQAEQMTKNLLKNNADPVKLREIYLQIAQTEEAKDSILNLINAIEKLHDMAMDHIDQNNPEHNWVGVNNYERTE